jgi:hypothetical protein
MKLRKRGNATSVDENLQEQNLLSISLLFRLRFVSSQTL